MDIEDKVIYAINLARRSLLFNKDGTWIKEVENPSFDVTMSSFDGGEVCELVGLYLLEKLSPLLGIKTVALYRDDGLAAVNTSSGPVLDRMRKNIISLFKEEGLSITIEINLVETDFLDVTFNLDTGKYFPFTKLNNNLIYIHAKSNHPSSIIKDLPNMVNKRLSDFSYNEEEFNKAKPLYENALKDSRFNTSIKYAKDEVKSNRNINRKIIWFNLPFSQNVKTNIGKTFIKLVKKHFPKHHKVSTIFNTNTLKLSYSCLKNMSSITPKYCPINTITP